MWESRICNPTNNITGNTTYISTNIPVSISTYISTYILVSIHLQAGFLFARRKEESRFICKFAVPNGGRGLWAMRQVVFPSCAGMEKRIGMLNIQNKVK